MTNSASERQRWHRGRTKGSKSYIRDLEIYNYIVKKEESYGYLRELDRGREYEILMEMGDADAQKRITNIEGVTSFAEVPPFVQFFMRYPYSRRGFEPCRRKEILSALRLPSSSATVVSNALQRLLEYGLIEKKGKGYVVKKRSDISSGMLESAYLEDLTLKSTGLTFRFSHLKAKEMSHHLLLLTRYINAERPIMKNEDDNHRIQILGVVGDPTEYDNMIGKIKEIGKAIIILKRDRALRILSGFSREILQGLGRNPRYKDDVQKVQKLLEWYLPNLIKDEDFIARIEDYYVSEAASYWNFIASKCVDWPAFEKHLRNEVQEHPDARNKYFGDEGFEHLLIDFPMSDSPIGKEIPIRKWEFIERYLRGHDFGNIKGFGRLKRDNYDPFKNKKFLSEMRDFKNEIYEDKSLAISPNIKKWLMDEIPRREYAVLLNKIMGCGVQRSTAEKAREHVRNCLCYPEIIICGDFREESRGPPVEPDEKGNPKNCSG